MGLLLERTQEIARRCGDLSPPAEPVRERLWDANRDVILAGVSPGTTRPVAALAPSTLKRRKGGGPPRAPRGVASRIVSGCVVSVTAGPGRLCYMKSWRGGEHAGAQRHDPQLRLRHQ